MGNVVLIVIFSVLLCIMGMVCAVLLYKAEREKEVARREAADAKEEFLSRISYDIKTPMNVIVGMTALGMEDTEDPEKMKDCLGRIHAASEFLMGLLGDLVDMSKIRDGRFRLRPRSYAFGDFAEEIRIMMAPSCEKKHIHFQMPGEEIFINMMVDPMRFQQLFFNLLANAVKFTGEGGEVSFRVCNYATHNNIFSADYVVKDNGVGMSSEFQQLLFEPFTQESGARAEGKNGAGLGLAIARSIVDLMGGTIEVKSELGIGTEVKVHLDVEIAAIQPEKTNSWIGADQTTRILRGKRVLLVEDHPLNVEIARKILEKQGLNVVCAENGQLALEMFESHPEHYFDLVLMDIRLPGMDGLEAARKIRKIPHPDAQIIPVIAMSANDSAEGVSQCKEAGMNDYIAKPVEPKKLYQLLCEYIQAPF